jgi:putative membrane protein
MATESPHTLLDEPGTNLASSRTALALERTHLATERTLMACMRTALSLIGFGFTIYQFISKFDPTHPRAAESARNFGIALILLGIATLVVGLLSQFWTLALLRARGNGLYAAGLLHNKRTYRPSPVGIIALLLLVLGCVAIVGMALRAGPLS